MKHSLKSRWLAALIVGLLTACGAGSGDEDEGDVVDQIIASQLNFEGVYADDNGLALELNGGVATIRALGSSNLLGLFRVGEAFMKEMDNKGDNRWIGYIGTVKTSTATGSKTVYWDYGSAIIKDGLMTSTDSDGNVRRFRYVGRTWTGSTVPASGGSVPSPVQPAPTAKVDTFARLEGASLSEREYSVEIPAGTTLLQVTLSESSAGGSQLADLFVRRGAEAVIVNRTAAYSWTADCASVQPNRETETCTFRNPAAGKYYITVYGYHAYWGADLKITRQ